MMFSGKYSPKWGKKKKKLYSDIHFPFSVKQLLSLTFLSLTIFIYHIPLFHLFSQPSYQFQMMKHHKQKAAIGSGLF